MGNETRDDLGRVLCCHGRPMMCLECGEDYAAELNQPRAAALDAAPSSTPEMILKVDDMLPQRQAMLSSEAAVRRALARVVADGGEERFIGEGYEAHDAIVEAVCEELAGAAGTVPPSAPTSDKATKDVDPRVGGVPSDRPLGSTASSHKVKST